MSEKFNLRVLAGEFKGRKIASPNDSRTHPMGAREKLALFNMVAVENRAVLDLYAGTGALGIEALSRGAKEVIFVEKAPAVAKIISENLQNLGVSYDRDNGKLVAVKNSEEGRGLGVKIAREAIQSALEETNPRSGMVAGSVPKVQVFSESCQNFCENSAFWSVFSVILADPPYNQANPAELARVADLLQKGGVLALSTPAKDEAWELPGLLLEKSRTYAGARISIYRKAETSIASAR